MEEFKTLRPFCKGIMGMEEFKTLRPFCKGIMGMEEFEATFLPLVV